MPEPPVFPSAKGDALELIDAAQDMVHALCQPRGSKGSREWIMSIPARPDYDPDLVIGSALRAAKRTILDERRAGLSPIARTEIADARAAFAMVWRWVSCGPKVAPEEVCEASGRVFKVLDAVLESTKEAGNG